MPVDSVDNTYTCTMKSQANQSLFMSPQKHVCKLITDVMHPRAFFMLHPIRSLIQTDNICLMEEKNESKCWYKYEHKKNPHIGSYVIVSETDRLW